MASEELLTRGVRRKLLILRGLLRVHLLGRGLCWVVVAAVAAVFVTLGIDWLLEMDRAQRALIAAVALGGIGYVMWRFLLRPMRVPMNAEELALVLEARYPQLDDRLISALQFAARPQSRSGASEAMIRTMAGQANAVAAELDAGAAVAASGTWRRMLWPAAALILLTAFTAFNTELMAMWFRRNVLLQDVRWPQQTYLTVRGGPEYRVVRGGSLPLMVTAEGELPEHVTFHMRFASLPGEVREAVAAAKRGGNTYIKHMENVSEGFTFYVTGNDDRTGRYRVVVVNPPELVLLEGTKRYPEYMNRPLAKFSPKRGLIAVPPGTSLSFTGKADKDLKSDGCCLRLDGVKVAQLEIEVVTDAADPEAAGRPRALKGTFRLPERVDRLSMLLSFELTDTEGIINPRGASYSLRIEPDRPPAVSMTRRHVRGEVTARARIPLVIEARDAGGGIAALALSAESVRGQATTTQPAPKESAVEGFEPNQENVRVEHTAELAPLGLKEGDRVRFQAIAQDSLPGSFGGPNVSRSVVQTFKIVSEEQLMRELVRRQEEIAQDFARAVVRQGEVGARVRSVGDRLATAGIDVETNRKLRSAAADQRRVGQQCAVAAQQLQGVLDEMICNQVGAPAARGELGSIVTDLEDLAKKTMPDVAAQMDGASKLTEADMLGDYVAEANNQLDEMLRKLQDIQERMLKTRTRQQLAYEMKLLIELGKKIRQRIEAWQKEQAEGVLDGRGEGGPDAPRP